MLFMATAFGKIVPKFGTRHKICNLKYRVEISAQILVKQNICSAVYFIMASLCFANIGLQNLWNWPDKTHTHTHTHTHTRIIEQGILKGEVSLYHWTPVRLVWNQLYDNWQFLFLFAKQTNPNQSNRRSTEQWYFPL